MARTNEHTSWRETGKSTGKPLDSAWVRAAIPVAEIRVNANAAAFLDGPRARKVPKQVTDAVQNYFLTANANTCGAFATSRANDAMIASARADMADLSTVTRTKSSFGQT